MRARSGNVSVETSTSDTKFKLNAIPFADDTILLPE